MSALTDAAKKKVTSTTTTSIKQEKERRPPKGAEIIEQTERTEVEQIENGFLLVKTTSGRYKEKDSKDSYGNYFDYSQKWFSEDNPIQVTLKNKELADAFDEEDGIVIE